MVSVIAGTGFGVERSSGYVLGSRGAVGQSSLGRAGENVFVNAVNGNLVITNRDEFLIGLGSDNIVSRAYNSRGELDGDNNDGWRTGLSRRVFGLTGVQDGVGSTITRTDWDGAEVVYAWNAGRGQYEATHGAGAYDTLKKVGTDWIWTDGDSRTVETYAASGVAGEWRIVRQSDTDGNSLFFDYAASGLLSRVSTQDGGYTNFVWSGSNLTQLATTYYDPLTSSWKSQTRTQYAYDSLNRLVSVIVDLSPTDNSVADGRTYVTTYTYDGASKRVASISQTDGSRIDIAYETSGQHRVTSIRQSVAAGASRTTTYAYVGATRTDVTTPDGLTTILEYDAAGQLTKVTEPPATLGATPRVSEFTYDSRGNVIRIQTSATTWTDFIYDDANGDGVGGDDNGLWTHQYERLESGGYIAARRTYSALNALLTETSFQTLDSDGTGPGQPSDPLTTRYAYDSENHLRFVVTPNGEVTRFDYAPNGNLIRSTAFTGARYNLTGLTAAQSIPEATLDAWAAGLADKTTAQITEHVYDFRGTLQHSYAYSAVNANGGADSGSPATRTSYIYDQAGRIVSRSNNITAGAQTFIYDGLDRLISTVDFDGATTRTAYYDRAATTVVTTAAGLNKIAVYNRAGEQVSYTESERGPNLVDQTGWPEYDPDLPNGPATLPGWNNALTEETRWQLVKGPDGSHVVAMQAGQLTTSLQGGGSHSNTVTIDGTKDYEFTYYFKKSDLYQHYAFFGLAGGDPAYVENAGTSTANSNPYFVYFDPNGNAQASTSYQPVQQDRWYKVVGRVFAQGSATATTAETGVFDVVTGQKMAEVQNFRWSAGRSNNAIHTRFFDYYEESELGFSTYFYKPEIRRLDAPGTNLVDLSNWPGPAGAPNGEASVPGWINNWATTETAWKVIDGPQGRKIVAMQAGQYDPDVDGGGAHTNEFTIDGSKSYEFTYYVRKDKLNDHALFFGLSQGVPAFVEYADGSGGAESNPYFFGSYASTYAPHMVEDRWYKVVGHVLAEGSTDVPHGSLGGVYDMETGQKILPAHVYRWRASRPHNQVYSRFFTYYDEGKTGFSTYFYAPEVRRTDQPSINLINNAGWPQPVASDPYANVPGWDNSAITAETRWQVTDGPEGRRIVAMQAGQFDSYGASGGGNYTPEVQIDGSKAYEFTIYLRKEDLTKHNAYFGLSADWGSPPRAYVDNAIHDVADHNPYFYATNPAMQQATLVEDRWYKVVGYVLPAGSPNLIWPDAPGGVYDTVTGEKVASTMPFRWRADRPGDTVHARFFTHYDETKTGWSTSFYRPEIRQVSAATLTGLLPPESTQHRYDRMGRLRMTIDPTGRSTHFIHDNLGRKVGEVDGDGSLIEYRYDIEDRLVATTRYATRLTAADLNSLTDAAGNPAPTEMAWIRPAASADDAWTWQIHDSVGRLIQTIDGDGSTTAYGYDGASRLVSQTRYAARLTAAQITDLKAATPSILTLPAVSIGADRVTRYFYDAAGRKVGELDPEGFLSRTVYDAAGHVVQTSTFTNLVAEGLRASGSLNAMLTSISADPNDIHAWSVYDGRGFLMATVNGEGDVVLYTYNALGHVTQTMTGKRITPPTSQPTLAQLTAAPPSPVHDVVVYDRNHLGQVTKEYRYTAAGREDVTYTYDVMHRLVSTHTDRLANKGPDYTTSSRYDGRGRLIGQLNGRGSAALAALGSSPTKAQIDAVYRAWGITFAYDAADRLISRTDPDGVGGAGYSTLYFYDGDGALAYEVNPLGAVKGYLYDAQNRRTQTIAFAAPISVTGLKGGRVVPELPSRTALSGADSRTVLTYNVDDTIRSSTDPLGADTLYFHNAFNELAERHDPFGATTGVATTFGYDRRGLLKHTTEDAGGLNKTTYVAYDAFGRANYAIDARGVARTTLYDRAGRVKVVRDGLNATTTYAYDPRGNVVSVTDRSGKTAYYSHDALNRTQTVTTAEGLVTTTTFDDLGHVLSVTDGGGRTVAYAYDLDGALTGVTNGLGQQDAKAYDMAGRLLETTDASGVKIRYAYDGAGRVLTETVDPNGLALATTYVYDAKGQRIRVTDPSGKRTDFVFDKAGRKTEVIVAPTGVALRTVYTYDRAGNVTNVIEAAGTAAERGTSYIYDKLGRLTYQQTGENTLNIRTAYDYDANGNVVRRRDGVSTSVDVTTRYVYDAENRLTFTVDPVGSVTRNQYDAEGRIIRTTGYATQVSLSDTALTEAQVLAPLGSSSSRTTDYVYDADGRLTYTVQADGRLTRLSYDGSGNVVGQTTYGKLWLPYDPDYALSWPYTVAGLNGIVGLSVFKHHADNRWSSAAFDAAGRQTYAIDAAGQITAFTYDAAGRVVRTTRHAALFTGGSITQADMSAWAAANAGAADRKTHAAYDTAGRASYTVDAEGYATRTTYRAGGQVETVSRFAVQLSVSDGVVHATLASLLAGHESTASKTTFDYDSAGRQYRTIDPEGAETRLELDGLSRVIQVREAYGTSDERVTNRFYDGGGRLITETIAPGATEQTVRNWVYDGLGRVVGEMSGVAYDRLRAGQDYYYTTYTHDAAGRVLTKTVPFAAGVTAVTTNTYDAFGNLTKTVDPRGNAGFFYYDSLDRLTLQVDPEGFATRTTYGPGGEVATVTRYAARTTGTPTATTPPTINTSAADAITLFIRDKLDRVTTVRDAQGYDEIYQLNAFGDRISLTNRLGGVTSYTYDRRGRMLTETLQVSSVVNTYQYDSRGNLTRTVEASNIPQDARTTLYAYDKLDRLVVKTGDAVTVTSSVDFSTSTTIPTETIAYDRRGNVIETKNAGGARTLFYYDDANRKVAEIDALGTLRTWVYDANNNATAAKVYDTQVALPTTPGGAIPAGTGTYRETLYAYDRNNRLTATTIKTLRVGEFGSGYASAVQDVVVETAHDASGNIVQTKDGRGVSAYAFYDKLGRQIATVDGEGYLTTWTRDAEGNVLREIRYADKVVGAVTKDRDPAGLPPRNFDSLTDRITDFTYDRNGRRLTETRYSVQVYGAAAPDRLAVSHAVITYAYNGLGGVTRKTEANGDYVDYVYDGLGREIRTLGSAFTDYQGASVRRQTDTQYNGLGAVTRVVDSREAGGLLADARTNTFSYGAGGRLLSATDATGFTRHFGYDAMGRMTRQSYDRAQSTGAAVTEGRRYAYDLLGRATSEASATNHGAYWSFGDTRSTAYNTHGEVTAKGVNGLWQERFEYDKAGRMWRSTGGDGVTRLSLYDRAGRATMTVVSTGLDITTWTTDDLIQAFTSGGVAIGAQDVAGVTFTFNLYDNRGKLTGSRQPFAQLSRDLGTGAYATATIVQGRTYNAFGEVTSETDARGHVTDFFYNTMGRLIEARRPEVAYTNEQGQALSARPTEQRRFDISGRLIATRTANGAWTARTLLAGSGHGDEEAVVLTQTFADGGQIVHDVDVFGDIRKVTNQLGGVTERAYDKAGRLTSVQHPYRAPYAPGNPSGSYVQLADYYAYDGLGQRIQHWNNQFGSAFKERTDYDREGRVALQVDFEGRGTSYSYNWNAAIETAGLGTFGGWIKTTNHASNTTSVDRTDAFGRSVGRTDMGGHAYAMTFDKGGRTTSQTSSAGQSLILSWYNTGLQSRQADQTTGGAQADYAYDAAGNRVRERYATSQSSGSPIVRQDGYAQYDQLGRMTSFEDRSANPTDPTRSVFTYDLNGNVRSTQSSYRRVGVGPSDPTYTPPTTWNRYDAMDRMVQVEGVLSGGQITNGRQLEYDAAGNRVRMLTDWVVQTDIVTGYVTVWVPDPDPDFGGGGGGIPIDQPIDPGEGSGRGHWESYTTYENRPGSAIEHYDYTADGYLATVGLSYDQWDTITDTVQRGPITLKSRDVRDAMGRLTLRTEWSGERSGLSTSYEREATYDRAGLITWSRDFTYKRGNIFSNTTDHFATQQTNYSYYEGWVWRGVVTSVTTSGYTDSWPLGGSTQAAPNTRTDYNYVWWDDARQSTIVYDANTNDNSNTPRTSSFGYDVNGRVATVYINDDRPRTVTFVTDANGQVLTRVEQDNNPALQDPMDQYYYFNGQRIGQVTNNASYVSTYLGEIYNRGWSGPTSPTPFQNGNNPAYGSDFDLAYEALTPSSIRAGGTAWTVRDGDTLQSIAAAAWGDGSLWYLIAEANGLTSASSLSPGQAITVPAKVGNVHNNSDTFRPYDPNEALGDVSPTQANPPKAAKRRGCGGLGQILMAIIAVVVVAIVAPYAMAALSQPAMLGGATLAGTTTAVSGTALTAAGVASGSISVGFGATMLGGAIAGAAGSIVSQAFGVAAGIQEKFDWKGVALSALSGAVGGAMKFAPGIGRMGGMTGSFLRGAASSAVTQGVAVAAGLQEKFSWTSVAVSAVTAAVGKGLGDWLDLPDNPANWGSEHYGKAALVNLGSAAAGAATQSLIDGTDFGDNLAAALPQAIGQTIGQIVAGAIQDGIARKLHVEQQPESSIGAKGAETPIARKTLAKQFANHDKNAGLKYGTSAVLAKLLNVEPGQFDKSDRIQTTQTRPSPGPFEGEAALRRAFGEAAQRIDTPEGKAGLLAVLSSLGSHPRNALSFDSELARRILPRGWSLVDVEYNSNTQFLGLAIKDNTDRIHILFNGFRPSDGHSGIPIIHGTNDDGIFNSLGFDRTDVIDAERFARRLTPQLVSHNFYVLGYSRGGGNAISFSKYFFEHNRSREASGRLQSITTFGTASQREEVGNFTSTYLRSKLSSVTTNYIGNGDNISRHFSQGDNNYIGTRRFIDVPQDGWFGIPFTNQEVIDPGSGHSIFNYYKYFIDQRLRR